MAHSSRHRLCFRWWRIRPASHIPEAEMMTLELLSMFSILDSSLLSVMVRPGKVKRRSPSFTTSSASSSR